MLLNTSKILFKWVPQKKKNYLSDNKKATFKYIALGLQFCCATLGSFALFSLFMLSNYKNKYFGVYELLIYLFFPMNDV